MNIKSFGSVLSWSSAAKAFTEKRFGAKYWTNIYEQFLPWALPVAALASWQIATASGQIAPQLLPSPLAVLRASIRLSHTELWQDLGISSYRAYAGFAIGGGLGLILGMLNGLVKFSEKTLDSSIHMLRTIPHLALMPLIIMWLGVGESTKVILIAMGVFFPVYLNTYHGMRVCDPGLVETGRVYGLKGFRLFYQVVLPAALPSIMVGIRFALGAVWTTLIAAEAIATESGIGYLSSIAREYMQTDVVVVCLILYSLLGKAADLIARILEYIFIPWQRTVKLKGARQS